MRIRVPTLLALCLACAVVTLRPAPAAAQEKDLVTTLSTVEQSLWEGWKTHDMAPFKAHLTDGAINVDAGGVEAGKEDMIEYLSKNPCDVKGYSFSDWAAHPVTDDVAILTYKATQDGTCGERRLDPEVVVSAVYVRQGGQWMAASYHETPARMSGM